MEKNWILTMTVQSWLKNGIDNRTEIDGEFKESDKVSMIKLIKKLMNLQFNINLSLSNTDITDEMKLYLDKIKIGKTETPYPQFVVALKALLFYKGYDTMNLSYECDETLKELIKKFQKDNKLKRTGETNVDTWLLLLL